MKEQKEIHIGSLIKEKMEERGLSVSDFAHALHYERTNIYKIFKRSSIDVDLLLRISEVLAYDFLREVYLADEPRRYSITIEADKEDIEEIRKWLLEKRREYIDDAREYRLASRPYDLCDAYGFGSGQFRSVGDPVFYIGGEYHE